MAPQKPPAFQFYPKDFITGTATMSLQEVGAYMRLLCYAWDAGSVPIDPNDRARICGCSKAQERELWKRVGKKFYQAHDAFFNERLEDERQKQAAYRQKQSSSGHAGAISKWKHRHSTGDGTGHGSAIDSPSPNDGSSSSSSSSSTSTKELAKSASSSRATLIPPGEGVEFDRKHGRHMDGFCDWCCLPMDLVDRFSKRIPGSDDGQKRHDIKQWALSIRAIWETRIIPDGSDYEFWTNRWTETHGGSRPANATLKAARAAHALDEAFR